MKKIGYLLSLGCILWLFVACTPFSPAPATVTPTFASVTPTIELTVASPIVTLSPTETATVIVTVEMAASENCSTGWSWAIGPEEPEFAKTVQEMMSAVPISGTVRVSTYGENDGCGRYHAMSTDFTFTIPVPDPADEVALAPQAETLLQFAQTANQGADRPAPNLGNLEVAFTGNGQRCYWRRSGVEWNIRCEGSE